MWNTYFTDILNENPNSHAVPFFLRFFWGLLSRSRCNLIWTLRFGTSGVNSPAPIHSGQSNYTATWHQIRLFQSAYLPDPCKYHVYRASIVPTEPASFSMRPQDPAKSTCKNVITLFLYGKNVIVLFPFLNKWQTVFTKAVSGR